VRTRAKVASVLSSAVVLLGAWELAGAPATSPAGTTAGGTTSSGSTRSSTAASDGSTSSGSDGTTVAPDDPASAAADGTYTGDVVSTRYGDAQVAVTISGGTITDVTAVALPSRERRSDQISTSAEPILRDEVLAAQSADVSIVSRATYTSDGYLQSLQSALDDAGW
jgi:uncharacterized protein with FMN-binding domain